MILHPAQYLGVADILTKRQNILSTVEKWQTESDTICCVEELLLWRRANTQKKHVQEPSNTWQTVHYTAGLLSTFHKCSVGKHPNQLPFLLVPLPQMSPEDRKTSLEYIAYNNATELWLHIGTIKPGYRMHCWRWISTKTAGFGFLSTTFGLKKYSENNQLWKKQITHAEQTGLYASLLIRHWSILFFCNPPWYIRNYHL